MAIAYLARNATSLAAANWSDAIGFADNATLVINQPFGGGVALETDADQSGLTSGIDYLDIVPGSHGTLGSAANPLILDADTDAGTTAADRVTNYGSGVTLNIKAGGNNALILNFSMGAGNQTNLLGGTFTNVSVWGGTLGTNLATVITNYDQYGGVAEIPYNATAITLARVMRGTCIIKRKVTTLIVGENARVTYDPDPAVTDFSSTTINQYGGMLHHRRGATPTILGLGGTHDFSQLRDAITPGGTSWLVGGTKIVQSDLLDDSNAVNLYGSKREIGGPTPQ